MKKILGIIALASIALISIGLVHNAFAFWPFDSPVQPNNNIITIRQADSIITYDKTNNKGSWQSAPPWVLDYNDYQGTPVYAPYKIWDEQNYTTFENAQSSITVEKSSCTIKIFDGGKVKNTSNPLINSISFNMQYAKNGTDTWYQSPENNQQCNVNYENSTNGLTADLVQGEQIQKDIQIKLYDNTTPELVLKIKNNNFSNTDTKYGFTVSISNSSKIKTEGDLVKFLDGKNQTVLEFDTQNSINHYLWTIIKTDFGLILDYENSKGPLLPGNTLEIDPTFTANPSPNAYNLRTSGTTTCGSYSSTSTSSSLMNSYVLTNEGSGCGNSAAEFNISTFPSTAIVSSVQIAGTIAQTAGSSCPLKQVLDRPSTTAGATLYAYINSATTYVSPTCNAGVTKINLGTTAKTDLANQNSLGWFAVGLVQGGDGDVSISNTQLLINYTLPVPNAVTNVSCNPTQALGNTCTWNNATSIGGKVKGFYVTRNGTNEPLYSSNLVGYWKLDGLNLSNKIEDYGTTKANGTVTGSYVNRTGIIANAMNFTGSTYVTTSSSPFSFTASQPFSISFWMKANSSASSIIVLSKDDSVGANSGYGFWIWSGDPTHLRFNISNGGFSYSEAVTTSNIVNNKWQHITGTYDGSGNTNGIKIFVNGTQQGTAGALALSTITNGFSFTMGGNSGSGSFKGQLDDVRIYNKKLSLLDISKLYSYTLDSSLSKLDTYLLKDGKTYNYCIYPVNQYGQNDTGTCATGTAKTYAPPPNQLNGKFYKDGSNHYNVQINWSKPNQFLSDNFLATGYKVQKLVGSTWTTILSNTTSTTYTDSNLQNTTTQKYRVFSNSHLGTSPGYIFENTNGTGLKTLYQFENNTLDSRGSNTISMTRDDNYTSGFIGYALALNGTQYGKSTATGVPNGTSDRTFSLWIKPTSFSSNSNAYLSSGSASANAQFSIIDANGKIDCGGAGNNLNSTTTLTANHWALITCVLSNSGQTRSIYINGTLDKSSTTTAINSASTSLYIGTRADNTNRNVTGLIDNIRVYNTALNSTYVSEIYNQAITSRDNSGIAGTHTVSFNTVGDITRATSSLLITTGFPPPTIVNWHLYNYSTIYNNTNVNTSLITNVATTFLYGNWFNIDVLHNFKAVAVVSNGTVLTLINSTTYPVQYIYLPDYTNTNGVLWNYTLSRPSPSTNLTLQANENPILFSMNCQIQTASDAAAGKGTGWYNQTNVGYFLQSLSIHNYDNIYGTCYTNSSLKLFTFISYGNSSLFPAIHFMDTSYGAYVGVPVGVIFIVMAASLGNRRTAPMWVVIILAMAGIMSTLTFFTLNSGVWALALIAGLLALFVGRKIG